MKDAMRDIFRLIRLIAPEGQKISVLRFRIVHRFRKPGTFCLPGEEITAVYLISGNRELFLPLPLTLRLLFDYLGHHRHLPQSATQIAAGIRALPFYRNHGMNTGLPSRRKISRTAVKEYIKRIRRAVDIAAAGRRIDAARLIVSKETVSNEVLYQLCAPVEWLHAEELPR